MYMVSLHESTPDVISEKDNPSAPEDMIVTAINAEEASIKWAEEQCLMHTCPITGIRASYEPVRLEDEHEESEGDIRVRIIPINTGLVTELFIDLRPYFESDTTGMGTELVIDLEPHFDKNEADT